MSAETFMNAADEIVAHFFETIKTNEAELGNFSSESPLYNRNELGKHHRKIWLQWAREKRANGEEVPNGWLIEFEKQNEDHQEVQRLQADALFALGYQAALSDFLAQTDESNAKLASVKPSKRSTIQAFTAVESRILIASVMAFVSYTLKR